MIKYDKVILMGSKTTAYKCAQIVGQKVRVHFCENNVDKDKIPSCYLDDSSITWHICLNGEWKDMLKNEKEKTLFISVVNQSILPKEIVEKDNITFVNLHFAILPNYRGRNCCGWALFNDEKITGATWHYLTEKVDEGKLLWQRKIPIAEKDTSLSLFRQQNNIGIQLFEENIEKLLHEDIEGIPQNQNETIHFHYAKDKPNNGFLDLNWSGKKISCFLRAMDYGPLYEFGVPMLKTNNREVFIAAYKIEKNDLLETKITYYENNNEIIIEKDNYKFTLNIK